MNAVTPPMCTTTFDDAYCPGPVTFVGFGQPDASRGIAFPERWKCETCGNVVVK